jgi:signal transduction histidine kinase
MLTIADRGSRIGAEQQPSLFQPFAAGASDADGGAGSGLGLSICAEIVRTPGGSIALDERCEGGRSCGLTATVRLPLADAPLAMADNGGR